jgi:hypothetical protein
MTESILLMIPQFAHWREENESNLVVYPEWEGPLGRCRPK